MHPATTHHPQRDGDHSRLRTRHLSGVACGEWRGGSECGVGAPAPAHLRADPGHPRARPHPYGLSQPRGLETRGHSPPLNPLARSTHPRLVRPPMERCTDPRPSSPCDRDHSRPRTDRSRSSATWRVALVAKSVGSARQHPRRRGVGVHREDPYRGEEGQRNRGGITPSGPVSRPSPHDGHSPAEEVGSADHPPRAHLLWLATRENKWWGVRDPPPFRGTAQPFRGTYLPSIFPSAPNHSMVRSRPSSSEIGL